MSSHGDPKHRKQTIKKRSAVEANMITFRDPIHGDIIFDGVIEQIIMTEEFQRLSEVKQLGLTDKVYAGANHTRFSHCIGACFLAGELSKRLGVPPKDRVLLQVAALLHDIGHYDFSHAIEHVAPYDHEENGRQIIMGNATLPGRKSGEIAAALRRYKINPETIIQLLHKEGSFPPFYYSMLSSPVIDCDRMDFLKRDTYYTGAVIGEIDIQRLLGMLIVHPKTKELAIQQKGVSSLEQFMVARMHMYQQVYLHPDAEAGETMLRKAVENSKDVAIPLMYGDGHLIARLAEQGTPLTKELVTRIRAGKRAFYPAAIIVDSTGSQKHLLDKVQQAYELEWKQPGSVEKELLRLTNLSEGQLLVTFPSAHRKQKTVPKFPVLLREGEWADFFEIAPIAKAAILAQISHHAFVVYSAPEQVEKVRKAAIRFLSP
jgi:uncharacterized protein